MSDREIGGVLIFLVLIQGVISVFVSHVLNGGIFKNSNSYGEGLRKLMQEKPVAGKLVIFMNVLVLCELVFALIHKL